MEGENKTKCAIDHGHIHLSQGSATRNPGAASLCEAHRVTATGGRSDSDFASRGASFYDAGVLELEVYAAGVRDLNKVLELDIELEAIQGLHYKVDRNHDIVYMELEGPTVTFRELRSIFRKLGLEPKFVGAIPAELRPKTKTQLLGL